MSTETKIKSKNFFIEIFVAIISCVVIYFLTAENTITTGSGDTVIIGDVHRKQVLYTMTINSSSFDTMNLVGYSVPEVTSKVEQKLKSLCHFTTCKISNISVSSKIRVHYVSSRFPQGYENGVGINFIIQGSTSPAILMHTVIKTLNDLEEDFEDSMDVD